MKKLNVIKALFAAAALTFALPGCSDLSTTDGNSALVEKEGKVGVKLAVSESYRTIISELPSDLKYSLTITGTGEGAKSENYTLESLTDSVVYYLEAGEYTFTLSGLSGEKIIVSGTTKQTVSANSSTVSIALSAVTGEAVDVTLNLTIPSGYGVKSVEASVYTDSELTTKSTDESDTLTFDSESSALKGTIVSGANKWVKIDLKDESGTIIGSKTEQLFMIAGSDIEATVTVPVKQYKATVKLTASEAKSITLKNSAVTSASYTGIVWAAGTATEESGVYTYSAYIPAGSYSISVDGSSLGTVSSVETVSVDASKAITGITAALKTGAPTFYSDGDDEALKNLILENILITVNYSDNSSDAPIPAKEADKDAVASITLDFTKTGEAQNATVTYSGQTATVSVTLVAVLPESIAVKTAPAKTTYIAGDELDLTGLVIDLTYNNGKTEEILYGSANASDFETSGFNSATAVTSQTVTVTYGGKSATFDVKIEANFSSFDAGTDTGKTANSSDYEVISSTDGLVVTSARAKFQLDTKWSTLDYDAEAGTGYTYTARVKVNKASGDTAGTLTIKNVKVGDVLRFDGGNSGSGDRKMTITGADETVWTASASTFGSFYLTATAETIVLTSEDNEFSIYGIHVVPAKVATTEVKAETTYSKPVITLSETTVEKSATVTITATIPKATVKTTYSDGKVVTTESDVTAEITYAGATVTDGKVDTSTAGTLSITASYTIGTKTYTSDPVTLEVAGEFEIATKSVANNEATLGLTATSVSSDTEGVATAEISDDNIVITSVAAGTATITASDGTNSATIEVTVGAGGAITTVVNAYSAATTDSWNLVLTEKNTDGDYVYGTVVFKNTTNIAANTVLSGASGNLNLTVTGAKFQINTSKMYGVLVKNTPITISSIKGKVKLTVVWGTESKTDRSLSVKVGSNDAVVTAATGKNIKNESETYEVSFDAGTGTDVVMGCTGDSFIKSITISAQ